MCIIKQNNRLRDLSSEKMDFSGISIHAVWNHQCLFHFFFLLKQKSCPQEIDFNWLHRSTIKSLVGRQFTLISIQNLFISGRLRTCLSSKLSWSYCQKIFYSRFFCRLTTYKWTREMMMLDWHSFKYKKTFSFLLFQYIFHAIWRPSKRNLTHN